MKGEANVVMLHINDILPNRFQPRIKFNENKIGELAESIKKYGVIQPIIVRRVGDKYEIIAGERRYKASVLANLKEIPAIINNLDDKDSSEVALIENVQRENLTPIEEAISYKKILDMGYHTQENLATKLGVSQSAVANKLRLLNLTEEVQEALLENKISERHARSLLKLKNNNDQVQMLYRVIQERLTVRKLDEEIEKLLQKESQNSTLEEKEDLNEEIEILNILNSYKEEKKNKEKKEEEKNMNPNDPMNQFDIPEVNMTNNNIQGVSNNQVQAPLSDANVNNFINNNLGGTIVDNSVPDTTINPTTNASTPGFMDIDRIQREAMDITGTTPIHPTPVQADPTLINMDSQPSSQVGQMEQQGKFFDVLPSMQNHQENIGIQNENPTFMNSNSSVSTPSIGENSNFTNILENPTIDPIPMQNVSSINENGNLPSSFDQPVSTSIETENRSEGESTPLSGINMQPNNIPLEGPIVVDPFQTSPMNNNSVEIPVNIPSNDTTHNEVVSPLPTFDFNMQSPSSQMVMTETNIQVDMPIAEQVLPSESDTMTHQAMNMGIPEVPIIEPIPVNPLSQEPIRTIDGVAPLEAEVPIPVQGSPIMNESINSFNMNSQSTNTVNIQMAINVINRANEELKNLGFTTTVEDLDLGNLHQITIRINK